MTSKDYVGYIAIFARLHKNKGQANSRLHASDHPRKISPSNSLVGYTPLFAGVRVKTRQLNSRLHYLLRLVKVKWSKLSLGYTIPVAPL